MERDIIIKRIEGIQRELTDLKKLGEQDVETFQKGDGWKLAQFHLHRALEGVFHIGSHILSRIPGATATQYREIALKLGEFGIVPTEFAQKNLVTMAKYRNRLVHFYAEVSAKELHGIIRNNLGDFDVFLRAIKSVLTNPEQFTLEVG